MRRLILEMRYMHTQWALREICPLHPDVPMLVVRLAALTDRRGA